MARKYNNIAQDICKDAVIFARVSSEKQEKGASISAQLETIYDYCKVKELNIIKEFIITESSTRGDRKQYQEMLKFVRSMKRKVAIVVNCVDRLQRSYKDTPALDDLRKEGRIEVHFLKENLILSKDSRGMDILFWNMCVLMANSYILSLSDNVKRSLNYNWSIGKWMSLAPIGFKNTRDEEGKSKIIIDEERAPIIKKLFQEYATGLHSSYSLLSYARSLGLVSKEPNHHKKSANYKRKSTISVATIIAILKNPFYYGMMSVKGQLMPHIHGNIIDKELFDKVQEILKERCETRKGYFHPQQHPHVYSAFRGLIKCGKCGKTLSPDTKIKNEKKKYTYLRCYSKCGQPTINENVLFQQLEKEIFNPLYVSPTQLIALRKSICKRFDDLLVNAHKIRQELNNQLNELTMQEDKATDLFIQGKLQEDIYNRKLSAINQEKQALRVELDKHSDHEGNKIDVIFKIIEIAGNLTNLMKNENPKKQQALLNLIIKDCTLNNQKLTYSIKPPFDQLLKCNNPKKWKDIILSNLSAFTDIEYYIRSLENKDY